jgi:uncharacterized protein DUF4184
MPFTAAHPAAVWPLARWGLPVPALVIGSIAPDIFTMLPSPELVHFAHIPLGLVTADLAIGLLAYLAWQRFYSPALSALVFGRTAGPAPIAATRIAATRIAATRMAATRMGTARMGTARMAAARMAGVVVAVLVGAATHLAWDSFTHYWMWGPQHIAWLAEPHGPLLGWQWVQKVSDLIGLAIVAAWITARWRSRPERPALRQRWLVWLIVLGPAAIAFGVLFVRDSFYVAITTAAGLGVIGLTLVALRLKPR